MDASTYNWSNLKKLPIKTLKKMLEPSKYEGETIEPSTLFQIQIQTVLGMRNER